MQKITLETLYTPYTLDTYSTFTMDNEAETLIEDYNDQNDTSLGYDDFDWDYNTDGYLSDLADNLIVLLNDNILDDVIKSISQDGEPVRPDYYNFTTDKSWLNFEIDQKKLDAFIDENEADYNKNKIKSYDGFMWFGDENQTHLAYYLATVSAKTLPPCGYQLDQYEQVSAYEYITMTPETT